MIKEFDHTDWLSQIDGLTVAEAIEYLQTLDQAQTLDYFMSGGDTHGVEVVSRLFRERKETEQELEAIQEQRKQRENKRLADAAAYYERQAVFHANLGNADRSAQSRKQAAECIAKIKS